MPATLLCVLFCSSAFGQQINADSLLNVVIARDKHTKIPPPISLDSAFYAVNQKAKTTGGEGTGLGLSLSYDIVVKGHGTV